jgi:hypothetical protein
LKRTKAGSIEENEPKRPSHAAASGKQCALGCGNVKVKRKRGLHENGREKCHATAKKRKLNNTGFRRLTYGAERENVLKI